MPQQAPGQSHREGLTLIQVIAKFGDEKSAKRWFTERLWPQGPYCPRCGSFDVREVKHPSMTHRCRDCEGRGLFSLKTGTVMQSSKLDYRTWALAIYLLTTNLKGVSSLKLHRDLGVTQKTAWHLAHRIREAWGPREAEAFGTAVEVDETYVGGKKRPGTGPGRGAVGKAVVAGVKERETGKVHARVVPNIKKATLHQFVAENVYPDAPVYTDELHSYRGIPNPHETVNHTAKQFVEGMAGTQGIESFWSILKRGYHGTFHKISHKHLDRYVTEFAARHNNRPDDTLDMMGNVAEGMTGRRLRYEDLIADREAA